MTTNPPAAAAAPDFPTGAAATEPGPLELAAPGPDDMCEPFEFYAERTDDDF